MCGSSLQWSQDMNSIRCNTVAVTTGRHETLQCTPWEKIKNGICVCKMPYECSSSLPVCVVDIKSGRTILLTLCKLFALKCLGRHYKPAADGDCVSPAPSGGECGSCSLWERCD
ncbi:complement component C7-like, partial [Carcharodon carcharias]|uniref:complement component C7-like n=1 Tax=Carcharodon carcharias TaxID=13397 RepID=UPI001B7EE441